MPFKSSTKEGCADRKLDSDYKETTECLQKNRKK